MDDLLDKFAGKWSEYEQARDDYDATRTDEDWNSLVLIALEVCHLLYEHDATVTFPAPQPPALEPDESYTWTGYDPATGGSWTRKDREP